MRTTESWSETKRLDALLEAFRREFAAERASHVARAPGRVNLIGEHTDYNGLPVFPMAIQRDVAIVFRKRDDAQVRLCNLDSAYPPREFTIEDWIAPFGGVATGEPREPTATGTGRSSSPTIVPTASADWGNYAKAAALALRKSHGLTRGIDAVVHGDIPAAAGLSSSSALVVACALALIQANDVEMERTRLMALLAAAERYVGTKSGGMDQAISLGGTRGAAVLIEFDPLRLTHVPVPAEWCFVIANSLVRAEKSGAAQAAYNARTSECRGALSALAAHPRAKKLAREAADPRDLCTTYSKLVRNVPVATLVEASRAALREPLGRRFRHVVTEAQRVQEARAAMQANDIEAFGRAMNASHSSLRDDYEVSCDALDRLVDAARAAGAVGARLTGAGFGGCIVALCERRHAESLSAALRREIALTSADVPLDAVMIAEPSDGAHVVPI